MSGRDVFVVGPLKSMFHSRKVKLWAVFFIFFSRYLQRSLSSESRLPHINLEVKTYRDRDLLLLLSHSLHFSPPLFSSFFSFWSDKLPWKEFDLKAKERYNERRMKKILLPVKCREGKERIIWLIKFLKFENKFSASLFFISCLLISRWIRGQFIWAAV